MKMSLAAGPLLRQLLLNNPKLRNDCRGVWPVIAPEGAELPYVCYRRKSAAAVRAHDAGCEVTFDVIIFDDDYIHGTALAEAAVAELADFPRAADATHAEIADHVGRIEIVDSLEGWAGDSYYHQLTVKFRIS